MTLFRAACLAALAVLPVLAAAQPVEPAGVTVYRYVPTGSPTVAVDLWGSVAQPGRYLVAPGVTLVDLLVLAGGPGGPTDAREAGLTTVTVTRGAPSARAVVARLAVEALADGAAAPELLDGDLVVVRTADAGGVSVDVWGAVGAPGRYEVAPGTSLVEVLTLAGGPRAVAESDRVAQRLRVTLSRAAAGGRSVVYDGAVEALASGPSPTLEAGDLVVVQLEQRARFGWRDALSIASASASLVLVVLRIAQTAP